MLKKFFAGFLIFVCLLVVLDVGLSLIRRPVVAVGPGGYGYDPVYQPHSSFFQDMLLYHLMFGGDHGWYGSGYYGHGFYHAPVVVHAPGVIYHAPAPTYSKPRWSRSWSGSTIQPYGSGTTSRSWGSGTSSRPFGGGATSTPSRPSSSWSGSGSRPSTSSWGSSGRSSYSSGSSSSRSFGSSASSSRSFGSSRR